VKLTVDSNEPLEDALRVVGSLYGVRLVVAEDGPDASASTRVSSRTPKKRSATTKPRRRGSAIVHARPRKSPTPATGPAGVPTTADIRSWARHTGLPVNGRGRVPATVLTAYHDAHQ